MKMTCVNAETAPQPDGRYTQALQITHAERWLFISGQIPVSTRGNVPADFPAQAEQVWANLCAQLDAAGMSITNLVKVTTYLSSREYAGLNSEIRQRVLGTHTPALSVIVAGIFDERWLLEIEAIAAA